MAKKFYPPEAYESGGDNFDAYTRYPPSTLLSDLAFIERIKRTQAKPRGTEKAFNPDQFRDDRGRWSSSGGGSSWGSDASIDDGGLRAGVEMLARAGHAPAQFILDTGRAWAIDDQTFIGGTAHRCYTNAAIAVLNHPGGSETYVEGYLSAHGIPIHHPWAVSQEGAERGYTIRDNMRNAIKGYMGVPLSPSFLQRSLVQTNYTASFRARTSRTRYAG